MKRTRRLVIEIEHRERSLTIRESSEAKGTPATDLELPQSKDAGPKPSSCPTCGSLEVVSLDAGYAWSQGGLARLSEELTGRQIHSILSGNDLWLCVASMKRFLTDASTDFRMDPEDDPSTPSG